MLPKVSIIVPIYKVEQYLNRCVDSILNQTYENLEVILVNDGSPDKCGEMIEKYARKDSRVRAVHKMNGGLSDARNYGMQYATGEYTVFVDSDDWLHEEMVQTMMKRCLQFNADVVQVNFYYAYRNHLLFDNRYHARDEQPVILDNGMLMRELIINERVKNFAWGKLYKTKLIQHIPFKKGVWFEDVFWAHQVMSQVNKYVMDHQPLCYYYQREDSISGSYSKRNLDIIVGLKERHEFIRTFYRHLLDESYQMLLKTNLLHYELLTKYSVEDPNGIYRKELQTYIHEFYEDLKRATQNNKFLQWQLYAFRIHPSAHRLLIFIEKVLRKLSTTQKPLMLERIDL